MGNSIPSNHEDRIAGKGENSLQHYNLVHNFFVKGMYLAPHIHEHLATAY